MELFLTGQVNDGNLFRDPSNRNLSKIIKEVQQYQGTLYPVQTTSLLLKSIYARRPTSGNEGNAVAISNADMETGNGHTLFGAGSFAFVALVSRSKSADKERF